MTLTREQLERIAKDPKAFLNRAYRLKEKMKVKTDRIESLREHAESITAELNLVSPGKATSHTPSKIVERGACNIMDLQSEYAKEIQAEIQEYYDTQKEIETAIQELVRDTTLQLLLEHRYLNGHSWEEIAVQMRYAYRWVLRLHDKALETLQKEAIQSAMETR